MPIYEYQCLKCKEEFEELVSGSSPKVACPHCSGKRVKKLMSVVAFKSGGKMKTTGEKSCSGCSSHSCGSCGGH